MKRETAVKSIAALAISTTIWLVYNLSLPNTDLETVNLSITSNIDGRQSTAYEEVPVVAQCSATGYTLLKLRSSDRKVNLFIDASQLEYKEGDFFLIPGETLFRKSDEIFGTSVTVNSFISSGVLVRFPRENHKRVPVMAVTSISFLPQYDALSPMTVEPDSVLVYGEPARLASIDRVLTKTLSQRDVKRSIHGVLGLVTPGGTRISTSQVSYSMEVSRYVDVPGTAPVQVRGVPQGKSLIVLPSEVSYTARCVFPRSGSLSDEPEFYVDYKDFTESIAGKCPVHLDSIPEGVIRYTFEPRFCECVENER